MDIRKTEHVVLMFFCFLVIVPILFIGRFADTNTFTSWKWVFSGARFLRVFSLLFPALFGAYCLSRIPLHGRSRHIFIFVLSIASILPLWSEPETIIDASRYFLQAKYLKEYGVFHFFKEWGKAVHAWTDMPLMPFLYGVIFSLLGEARIYIQAFNAILFALTAVLTCRIGETLWDEETGFNAGLLLTGIPYLLMQVPLLLIDVPTMFFLTLTIAVFLSTIQKGGVVRTGACALAISLTLFSKYSTWPMLFIIPVISIVFLKKEPKRIITRTFSVMIATALVAGTLIALRADFFYDQITLLKGYQWPGLSRWQEGFVSTFLFQTHPFITGLALFGAYKAARGKDMRFLIPGWFLLLIVLLRITRIRYMIPVFPLFVLMASYGLNKIKDNNGGKRLISLCLAATSLVIAHSAYLPFLNGTSMMNLKKAGEYLDTVKSESIEVYALPQKTSSGNTFAAIPLLDYYTRKKIICPQDWPVRRKDQNMSTSSMRFTWEMKKPLFYSTEITKSKNPIVVLSDEAVHTALQRPSMRITKRFDVISDHFKYQTLVTVYENEP